MINSCDNHISDEDRAFMKEAGSAGLMEVKMGQLTVEKASTKNIVDFAKMMVKEHTQFNDEFTQLLKKLHESLDIQMNERNRQMVDELSKLNGKDFEDKYVDDMITDHMVAVGEFQNALQRAKNSDYKKFLENGTIIVKHHYEMAKKLKDDY
jgi:putative membrane protein